VLVRAARQSFSDDLSHLGECHLDPQATDFLKVPFQALVHARRVGRHFERAVAPVEAISPGGLGRSLRPRLVLTATGDRKAGMPRCG
jgi:hypothetical protein